MKKVFLFLVLFLFLLFSYSQTHEFLGMTFNGKKFNTGVIFKTDTNGNNFSTEYDFLIDEGGRPYGTVTESSNGKFYGMTSRGGTNDLGVLFEYDPSINIYTKKFEFDGINKGGAPHGSLIRASNGKLYGMARGGINYDGVIFEYDPSTNIFTKKFDFNGSNTGSYPEGSLIEASNGKLYGMTESGGTDTLGVLFEYDPFTNAYTKKLDFDGINKGGTPYGSLIEASNGKLYGMTREGGTNNLGVLFEFDLTTNTYTKKLDFDGANYGSHPLGSLMEASNGKLYGMTNNGGTNGYGVIFEYDPINDTYTKKLDFDGANKGSFPQSSLMEASNGKLYGMTGSGGTSNWGVIFEYDPNTNTYTKKFDFPGINQGGNPRGSLMEASNGKLYGMTNSEGTNGSGVFFEYDLVTNSYTKKLDFDGANKGKKPKGSLMEASNGKLYGMTRKGGTSDLGILFKYEPLTKTYEKILDFNGDNGGEPEGSLVEASNGKLYGMTSTGGVSNWDRGVLFEFDPSTNTYIKKLEFDGYTRGSNPRGSLVEASNGKLYGLTYSGGNNSSDGVIFEYDPSTNNFNKKFDFDATNNNGQFPYGSLIEASNGKLYGMTRNGGINYDGVIFEYDPSTNNFNKKFDFDRANKGSDPEGSLVEASNGKLYGMTSEGGTNNLGVLFEFDLTTNTYTKKLDFDGANYGSNPRGSLMEASNGKLYGMTNNGGTNGYGVIFEYDPINDTYTKKLNFNDSGNGSNPFGNLIEFITCSSSNTFSEIVCDSYSVPSGDETYTTSGTYFDTIPNSIGCDSILIINLTINSTSATINETACDSFTVPSGDETYMSSGTVMDTIPNAAGCDSVLTINLTVNSITSAIINETACDSYTVPSGDETYTTDGTVKDTIPNAAGCDSLLTINFTINSPTSATINKTACDSYTVPSGDDSFTNSGTVMDTIPNAAGCDSVLTINLTINNSNTGLETVTVCDSYTWPTNGTTYNSSGAYTDTLTNQVGCDSVVTLNLTINQPTAHAINPVACDSYTVPSGDETYITSGLYNDTIPNATGCDSLLTINLTINNSNTGSETVTTCDSYTWPANSTTYTSSGAFTATLTNQAGCDSIATLNLTINQSTAHAINPIACDSYTVPSGDETYTTSGAYNDTIPNAAGCDSILTINLVVNSSSSSSISETACGSYTVPSGDETYTSSGIVMDTIPNSLGCDSVMTITLTINNADTSVSMSGTTLTSNATGAIYQWLDCDNNYSAISNATNQSYTATVNGNYAVKVTENNCTDTSYCYNVNSVGVSELAGVSGMNVYPNPNTGQFMIDLGSPYENVEITIRDLRGKIVYKEIISQQTVVPLNLEDKAEGVYLINVNTGTEQFIKKLVIH